MSFTPRTFDEILRDMVAHVQFTTDISDFNPGSVARTLLEAAALEDDEQYFQMVQLLDMFSIANATGPELDRRMADFNLVRRPARPATTRVRFFDGSLITNLSALDVPAGSSQIVLFDGSSFPIPSPSYVIRIGEGTSRVQEASVIAISGGLLTLASPLTFDVSVQDRVSVVTGHSPKTINIGVTIQAPPTVGQAAKVYATKQTAFIAQGNYFSNEVVAAATTSGSSGNVGPQRISQFSGPAPFTQAGVINVTEAGGGTDRESDDSFRLRGAQQLQSLSRGTPLALVSAAQSVTNTRTGQSVASASLLEDFANDEVRLFIDDGTGLEPDIVSYPAVSLTGAVTAGATSLPVGSTATLPSFGTVLVTDGGTTQVVVNYVSLTPTSLVLETAIPLGASFAIGDIVYVVEVVTESAESAQQRFQLTLPPVVRGSDRIWLQAGPTQFNLLARDVDYRINKGTGEFQLLDAGGAPLGAKIVASYGHYVNLIADVQKTLEGDLTNPTAFPGVKAAGIFLSVEAPTLRRITVLGTITAAPGFTEDVLRPLVQSAMQDYISSLRIGQDVIRSKLIDVAFNIPGVQDVTIALPLGNIVILENEIATPFDANDESLVFVT